MNKLVLIDGNAIMHRAYHALPHLTTKDGEPINAVYGLVSMLTKIIQTLKPTHIAVCFDRSEPTFRKLKFKNYQAQRPETEKELSGQFEKAREVLSAMNIPSFDKVGFEADDLIGTIAKKSVRTGSAIFFDEVVIVTGDRDILQLVDDNKKIRLYMPVKSLLNARLYKEEDVVERMGVAASKIIDYKALVGDPSDNYPGVAGIGPKTAINLLDEYGNFENIYKCLDKISDSIRTKLINGKENGQVSQMLAKIITNVPIDLDFRKMENWDLGSEKVVKLFGNYGFRTLLGRVQSFKEKHQIKKNLASYEVGVVCLKLAKKLNSYQYAIRGTASLVLQGYDMGVDDIDIVCDEKTALKINDVFKKDLIEEIKYSESDKFKSFFGKLVIDSVLVEIMGEWQIKNKNGEWGMKYAGKDEEVNIIKIKDTAVKVTKPEIELKVSTEMGRWNEYHKIRKQVDVKSQQSLF